MKFFTRLLVILFLHTKITAQVAVGTIDVQRYIFNVELNDNNDSITGTATILIKLIQGGNNIAFDLISIREDGKGMKINSVTENGKMLKFTHSKDIVRIQFPTQVNANDEKTIQLRYMGIPADGLIITKNKYNHRSFFADHWPNRARNWLPCNDHPSDKAAVEFIVIAPLHYQFISNGSMVEETNLDSSRKLTHYIETVPIPMKVAVIGVADFAVHLEGEVGTIPVHSWVYPEDRVNGFFDFHLAMEILPFFIRTIGAYPYKKLANVQSKTIFGGMENAGAIFYSESTITGTRSGEVLVAHEIAHQWFGNMVTEREWPHVWLSEGFATYMAILYMENKYGQDTAIKMRLKDRDEAIAFSKQKPGPVVDATTINYLELLNANSYQKAGWILHMLRQELGDSVFLKGVRSYYAEYAGKNALTDDFQKIMQNVSGKDLEKFFQQWLFTAGHPKLEINWKYNPKNKEVLVNVTQLQPGLFEFMLAIQFSGQGNGEPVTKKFMIHEKQTSINIRLQDKPLQIIFDPFVNLMYEGTVKEIK